MNQHAPQPQSTKRLSTRTTLLVVGGLIAYVVLQPSLERWLGVELPSLGGTDRPAQQPAEVDSSWDTLPPSAAPPTSTAATKSATTDAATTGGLSIETDTPEEPAAGKPPAIRQESTTKAAGRQEPRSQSTAVPKLGVLKDVGGKVLESTAGLRYGPGSQEGHRVKHILRHNTDDPDRPVHGVFDGDAGEVFALIDEAYLYTFDRGPPQVTTEQDDGRTIYVVDLGRRIGYVGGQSGQRQDYPAATHVQLVLEGSNVITAYPVSVQRRTR